MKMLLLLFVMLLIHPSLKAQDQWMAYLNKKLVLKTSEEQPERNRVKLTPAMLAGKKSLFSLSYLEKPMQAGWSRSFMLVDDNDREIRRIKGSRLTLSSQQLYNLLKKHKTLHIYTWSLPDDPELKARIRVRRVHLCSLVLE